MPTVDFTWYNYKIDLRDNLTEKRKRLSSKEAIGGLEDKRAVYIITINEPFCISYPRRPSNILYIGRGAVWNRLNQGHSKWMEKLQKGLGLTFSIHFGSPRVQKTTDAYKHVEGDLIRIFIRDFGDFPLINRQSALETKAYDYSDAVLDILKAPISDSYMAGISLFLDHSIMVDDLPE